MMPRLSDRDGPRAPDRCQRCGAHDWAGGFRRWRECDENDQPTDVIVVLCRECSGKPLQLHPRLYVELEPDQHWPGTMELCIDCRHRRGLICPLAMMNGGPEPGVGIGPGPTVMHVRAPGRLGGRLVLWPAARTCTRREVLALFDGEGGPHG